MIRVSDEIKEILDRCAPYLFGDEVDKLYNYITNLQERCAYLERSNDRREDTIIGLRFEVAEQEDYKSRCEKAIEYIEDNTYFKSHKGYVDNETLLNILQNGSDSQW